MNNEARMKGTVVGVGTMGTYVQVWVASPTGDSSDSFTYDIPCLTESQAQVIAEQWKKVWGLTR
jgi:hypothetical protein